MYFVLWDVYIKYLYSFSGYGTGQVLGVSLTKILTNIPMTISVVDHIEK